MDTLESLLEETDIYRKAMRRGKHLAFSKAIYIEGKFDFIAKANKI